MAFSCHFARSLLACLPIIEEDILFDDRWEVPATSQAYRGVVDGLVVLAVVGRSSPRPKQTVPVPVLCEGTLCSLTASQQQQKSAARGFTVQD
jgi:hypothetical protein